MVPPSCALKLPSKRYSPYEEGVAPPNRSRQLERPCFHFILYGSDMEFMHLFCIGLEEEGEEEAEGDTDREAFMAWHCTYYAIIKQYKNCILNDNEMNFVKKTKTTAPLSSSTTTAAVVDQCKLTQPR